MATLSFEGSTQEEIVDQVRHWLASIDGEAPHLSTAEAIKASAELTKDALDIVARVAPRPISETDLIHDLVGRGHQLTDASADALIQTVEAVISLADENVESARDTTRAAVVSMSQEAARRVLRTLSRSASGPT